MKIAKGGLSWIIISFTITVLLVILALIVQTIIQIYVLICLLIAILTTFLLLLFFRDPHRTIGKGIVAVADGVIQEISQETDKDVGDSTKISTFMNIHSVHVNRMPLDGALQKIIHHKGGHLPAFTKESNKNERVILLFKTNIGNVKIIQIAGTIARRIVPYVHEGDKIKKGEKIGMIRLGSRVDVYLPTKKNITLSIERKEKIRAGEDTIAKIND